MICSTKVFAMAVAVAVSGVGAAVVGGFSPVALVNGELSYELVSTGEILTSEESVSAPAGLGGGSSTPYFSQDSVREAAALANFVIGLQMATEVYFAELIAFCEAAAADAEIECPEDPDLGLTCEEYIRQEREYIRLSCLGNEEIAPDIAAGLAVMSEVEDFLAAEAAVLGGDVLAEEIGLAADIVANMTEGGPAPPYNDEGYATVPWAQPGGGGLGATAGGPQDFGYIRLVVAEGFIPLPFHLAVEGLFAEHDLPIESDEPCQELLCVRSAIGLAPAFDTGELRYYVQIGFSSGLDPETFERRSLNLVVVVDKSGSMSDSVDDDGTTKMAAVRSGLSQMVDRLDADDRLAIVVFEGDASVLMESTPVVDPVAVQALISTIAAGGSTNIEAGLELGFAIAAANSDPEHRLDRVMLLTDALPNVGEIGEGSFLSLAQLYSDEGVGLTTFGVGFNFGQELVLELSRIRGGNYFFLENAERIQEVFTQDFDYIVTPLAYDLRFGLRPGLGFAACRGHGVASWTADLPVTEVEVATVFLSRRRGAVLLELSRRSIDAPFAIYD